MLVILVKVMSVSINEKWSVFLESSEERGAAGPTIEPNENWIRNISVLEIILGLDKHIMELLGFSYLEVARVSCSVYLDIIDPIGFLEGI